MSKKEIIAKITEAAKSVELDSAKKFPELAEEIFTDISFFGTSNEKGIIISKSLDLSGKEMILVSAWYRYLDITPFTLNEFSNLYFTRA